MMAAVHNYMYWFPILLLFGLPRADSIVWGAVATPSCLKHDIKLEAKTVQWTMKIRQKNSLPLTGSTCLDSRHACTTHHHQFKVLFIILDITSQIIIILHNVA